MTAERWTRCEEEVAAFLTDPRVSRLRELTGLIPKGCPDEALKAEQAELLAALWADDPQFWTLERLAAVCGHKSSSSARRILQRARRDDQAPRVCGALPRGPPPIGAGCVMVSDDRLRDIETRQRHSARLRERFGLDRRGDPVADWLRGAGAVPFALAAVGLVVYAVVSILAGMVR